MKLKILQIKDLHRCKYSFMDYDWAIEHGFTLNDYEEVYECDVEKGTTLEDIFYIFNIERPEDFSGHSLSMSDIVELDGKMFYCDFAGWVELY